MAQAILGNLNLIVFVSLILIGYTAGKRLEKRHYKSIHEREMKFLQRPTTTTKTLPGNQSVQQASMAIGAVVVSVDYFKRFLATIRMIFGGEVSSYASLIDRGKREAILRMKESCPNADLYLNFRLETAAISQGRRNKVGSIEFVAYSTAINFKS